MHFRVSIEPFGNFCIPIMISLFVFSSRLNFSCASLSLGSHFFPFSHFPISPLSSLSVLISAFAFIPLIPLPLFFHFSDSVLLWTGGRAAGILHPCVREGNHRGDVRCGHAVWHSTGRPRPTLSRMTCARTRPPVVVSKYWRKGIEDNQAASVYPSLTGWYLRRRESSPSSLLNKMFVSPLCTILNQNYRTLFHINQCSSP